MKLNLLQAERDFRAPKNCYESNKLEMGLNYSYGEFSFR